MERTATAARGAVDLLVLETSQPKEEPLDNSSSAQTLFAGKSTNAQRPQWRSRSGVLAVWPGPAPWPPYPLVLTLPRAAHRDQVQKARCQRLHRWRARGSLALSQHNATAQRRCADVPRLGQRLRWHRWLMPRAHPRGDTCARRASLLGSGQCPRIRVCGHANLLPRRLLPLGASCCRTRQARSNSAVAQRTGRRDAGSGPAYGMATRPSREAADRPRSRRGRCALSRARCVRWHRRKPRTLRASVISQRPVRELYLRPEFRSARRSRHSTS